MNKMNYLPLGSIVIVKEEKQKLIIIGRALQVRNPVKDGIAFYDYAAVPYPQGLTGSKIMYFNHNRIKEIIHRGYSDQEDQNLIKGMNQYFQNHPEILHPGQG